MSEPESAPLQQQVPGARLGTCAADVVEILAHRGCSQDLQVIAGAHGRSLPQFGRVATAPAGLALCVRPDRWLLLSAPAAAGVSAATWQSACAGRGVAIECTSGLMALHFAGTATREVLARACRLDLDPEAFVAGRAAATVMAQVPVILAALPSGFLLLTPASTARHFREWLESTARPFGLESRSDLTLAQLCIQVSP